MEATSDNRWVVSILGKEIGTVVRVRCPYTYSVSMFGKQNLTKILTFQGEWDVHWQSHSA